MDVRVDQRKVAEAVDRFNQERRRGSALSIDEILDQTIDPERTADLSPTRLAAMAAMLTKEKETRGEGDLPSERETQVRQTRATLDPERPTLDQPVGTEAATVDLGMAAGSRGTVLDGTTFDGRDGKPPDLDGYRLVSCLGRGGMGVVYEGYQEATGRRVAVKFMLDAMGATETARKRFEREVELVARLSHPGIVSVLDSGVRKGRYFYTMEYVAGKPLDGAMPPGKCGVREAMVLMAQVCDAMDYAHQRGVLHRDLKPSNILVDDEKRPHLLDFGLAKSTDDAGGGPGGSHGEMGLTMSGQGHIMGTVAYMSPEQARGENDQTSVRTDVYSLGAIAYELATGKLPVPVMGSLRQALNFISELDPPAPSTIAPTVSADLDAVLLRALEKAPERRYATAGDFAADLRRFLNDEPVVARRVGSMGRAVRWVRRNRGISTVIGAAALLLIGVSTTLITRIVQERDRANENLAQSEKNLDDSMRNERHFQQTSTLLKQFLEAGDPGVTDGELTVAKMLEATSKRLDLAPPEQVRSEIEMREVIAQVSRNNGSYAVASDNLAKAIVLREKLSPGTDSPELADDLHNLAAVMFRNGEYVQAEARYARALAIRRRLYQGDHAAIAMSLTHLAACRLRMNQNAEAADLYTQALDMRQRLYKGDNADVAASMNNLAKTYSDMGEYTRAAPLFKQAYEMISKLKGSDHLDVGFASHNLAASMLDSGDYASAIPYYEKGLAIRKAKYKEDHHIVASSMCGLARARMAGGELGEAERLARRGIQIYQEQIALRKIGAGHPELADAMGLLGSILTRAERASEAESPLREALAISQSVKPPAPRQVSEIQGRLGECLTALRRFEEAEKLLLESYASVKADHQAVGRRALLPAERLRKLYTQWGRNDEAAKYASTPPAPEIDGGR